jgi:hypothetical protein
MKLYLDENLSPKFRHNFDNQLFQVFTYQFMGWQGKKNGELLSLLTENNFKGIITSDQLMYTDKQLRQYQLHFLLIQSAFDTPDARVPLFDLLNLFLIEHYSIYENAQCSKTIITDGIVDHNLTKGVHLIWID